jgi:hypothetical protein
MAEINKYDKQHIRNLSAYEKKIDEIYKEAAREAAAIGASIDNFNPDKLFTFDDYPQTKKRIDKLLNWLKGDLTAVIVNGIKSEWTLANNKNNELARMVFGDNVGKLTQEQYRHYFSTNSKARDAFITRKENGLNLSDRVWKYTHQFKEEIELALDVGIRNGLSADEMSRELKDYLRHTDKLFRRVRDEHGILQLSKRAAAFHPGQGVYRSSYKNARRLAATETNIAYRTADYERWQQLDFVVGIEIKLSNNHTLNGQPFVDICDDLKGKYPKDFKFTGWHPHCRCHAISILKTEDELMADNKRILNGEEPSNNSQNSITGVPENYRKWMSDNADRIKRAQQLGTLPYFIRDNKLFFNATEDINHFVMSIDDVAALKDFGWQLPNMDNATFAKYYNNSAMSGFDIFEFSNDFTRIMNDAGCTLSSYKILEGENYIKFRIAGSYGKDRVVLSRIFSVKDGIKNVHHDLFIIPDSLQGKGLSKKTFQTLYKQYRKAGVNTIDVFANLDVGGYTWARYGFRADTNDVRDIIVGARDAGKITDIEYDNATSVLNDFISQNGRSSKFPMNQLADKDYGKKLLLGQNWEGYLDLRDASQRERFEKYLTR